MLEDEIKKKLNTKKQKHFSILFLFFRTQVYTIPCYFIVHCYNEILRGFSILLGFGPIIRCEWHRKHIIALKKYK